MSNYAKNANVSVEQTQLEIQKLLQKNGATKFGIDFTSNTLLFELKQKSIKLIVPLPSISDFEFTLAHIKRQQYQIEKVYEQAIKQRWRALLLIVKAKMEAISSRITTIEQEFLPSILLPNGQTLSQYIIPQLSNTNIFPLLPEK